MKKYVFFFPWKEVSGGPFYLTRIAKDLAEEDGTEVHYVEYRRGLTDTMLRGSKVKKILFNGKFDEFMLFLDEPICLILPIYWAHLLPKMHPDSKVMFFNWHNECIPVLKRDWNATDSTINAFLEKTSETNAVFFCDKTHLIAQETDEIGFKEQYVPVIVPPREGVAKTELVSNRVYNIAILGRLVPDKVYSAIDVVENVAKLKLGKAVNVHIIGDGVCQDLLLDKKFPKEINLIHYGTLEINDVIQLLANEVDILFAMGTSVLEGASIGLPSVIIPNEVIPFHCNRYCYVFDSKGCALGWGTNQIDALELRTRTMKQIIKDIYMDGKKAKYGKRCKEYCEKNHYNNVNEFLEAIELCTLSYVQMEEFFSFLKSQNTFWEAIGERWNKALGISIKSFHLLGVEIFSLRHRDVEHFNLFFCWIPLLQFKKNKTDFSINILLLSWMVKVIQKSCNHLWEVYCRQLKLHRAKANK